MKMKKTEVYFATCLECPYFDEEDNECMEQGVEVEPHEINKNCPLEDVK